VSDAKGVSQRVPIDTAQFSLDEFAELLGG